MNEFLQRALKYNKSLTLFHHGDCSLLGVSLNSELYLEEIYGEDDEVSRYSFNLESDFDTATKVREIYTIPNSITRPLTPQHTTLLNFNIGRYRGLREAERIADIVHPLTIEEKMALVKFLPTPIMPPLLLGIAESTVLAEAPLIPPDVYLVCRRVRLAYALTQPRLDSSRQKYDYDSAVLHFIHLYDVRDDDEHPLHETIASGQSLLGNVVLHRPLDCLIHNNYLLIADGGDETRTGAVHLWTINKQEN